MSNDRITVVATEATRNAINQDELLSEIEKRTGWTVRLLSREEEGRLGAMGIASSVNELDGICVDMGGGSVQLTWASKSADGDVEVGPSISLPYGAAALLARISGSDMDQLHTEIHSNLRSALEKDLQIPAHAWDAAKNKGGFRLYLSGGGLRGWGHILMSTENVTPYPIPIINGYNVTTSHFYNGLTINLDESLIHRISKRRASQVPAVKAFIVALRETQLPISQVTFVQGGVREGLLYSGLPQSVRAESPLLASTLPYAPPSASQLLLLLECIIPKPAIGESMVSADLLKATVNLLYVHGPIPKDNRASSALRCTTTGILAGAHGLSHYERSILALIMCERWGCDIPDVDSGYISGIRTLCGPESWWARYIGRAAKGLAEIFPAGLMPKDKKTMFIQSGLEHLRSGPNGALEDSVWIHIEILSLEPRNQIYAWAKDLEKLGKKKHWAAGEKGIRVRVIVTDSA